MGSLVELELPNGYKASFLCKSLEEAGVSVTLVNLKSFRVVYNSTLFLTSPQEHLKKAKGSKSLLILDNFDLWCTPQSDSESEGDFSKNNRGSANPDLKKIRKSEGVEDRVRKCSTSWVYKLLYWLRYSVLYLLREEFEHELTCAGVYADPFNARIFYHDLFTQRQSLREFLSSDLLKDLDLGCLEGKPVEAAPLKPLSRLLDSYYTLGSGFSEESVYDILNKATRVLSLEVPFEVDFESLELSAITLICGPESSGKSTLLKAVSKALHNISADCQEQYPLVEAGKSASQAVDNHFTVFTLDYYELASQFVGCAESYVKDVFARARFNRPSLVVFDGIELLFERVSIEDERAVSATVSNTLLNQLHNLDGVKFLTCTSGNFDISQLSHAFLSMVTSVVVLNKKGDF